MTSEANTPQLCPHCGKDINFDPKQWDLNFPNERVKKAYVGALEKNGYVVDKDCSLYATDTPTT